MKWNKLLKSLLKTTIYILDQTAEQVDRVADRTSEITDQAKRAVGSVVDSVASSIQPREDHTLRNIISFAAGVGIGVGAGILLAPASGGETRSSISNKVKDIGNKVKGRVSTQDFATGTD